MSGRYRIEQLAAGHDRSAFASGSEPLDRYFRAQATQDARRRLSFCFVAVEIGTGALAGFCTLAATHVPLTQLPTATTRQLPRYPVVPAVLLGRLAVDGRHQAQGLGVALVADALARALRAEIATFAMVVDAKDERARRFYERLGFAPLPGEERRLVLPLDSARALVGESGA